MERTHVISRNLYAVGYDETTFTLEIEFNSGATYQYYGVPASVYRGLMFAGSKGQYFDHRIRNGHYRYREV